MNFQLKHCPTSHKLWLYQASLSVCVMQEILCSDCSISQTVTVDCSSFQQNCHFETLVLSVQILKERISHSDAAGQFTKSRSSCVRTNVKQKRTLSLKLMATELREADTALSIEKDLHLDSM